MKISLRRLGAAIVVVLAGAGCSDGAQQAGQSGRVAPAEAAPAMEAASPPAEEGQPVREEAGAPEATDAYSRYLKQVDERTVIAGLLDLEALRAEHPGEVLIVDLRTAEEGTAEEAAAAERLGFSYANIPVAGATVDPAQVAALRATLEQADPEALLVVHCASGNRASMLWGAVQLEKGASLEDVRARVAGILTKEPAIDGLEAFARSLNGGS